MRKELELMETIDNYLKGKLPAADKTAFEKKINSDPELKKEVELQKQLLKGIERTGLKQSAKQAGKKYQFNRNLRNWGFTGLAIAIVATSVSLYKPKPTESATRKMADTAAVTAENPIQDSKPENVISAEIAKSEVKNSLSISDVYSKANLKTQSFTINPTTDTILKSEAGVKVRIGKNSFADKSGKVVNSPVKIDIKEALTPYDIAMANLVTKTGDKTLESGGMLNVAASSNGQNLQLMAGKSLMIAVPTEKQKKGMQAFEGKQAEGSLDWVNPKPLLNPVNNNAIRSEIVLMDTVKRNIISAGNGNSLATSKGFNSFAVDNSTSYLFSMAKLGWANIDRLASDPRTRQIELITKVENKKDFAFIYSTITFPNQNMYIPGYEKADGTYSFTHGDYETTKLPVGETAVIIATATKDNKIFLATKKLTITDKQTVNLKLEEVTEPELKKIIRDQLGYSAPASPAGAKVEAPLTIVEQMPDFPGGNAMLSKFINQNVKYPQKEKEEGVQGTCFVTFVVEPDGSINDVKILKGIAGGSACDQEAVRVVRSMPKWNPGRQNGRVVRVQYNLPIKFTFGRSL